MLTTANITKDVTNQEHFSNDDDESDEEESEEPEIIPIQPKPFVCDLCDRGFQTKGNMMDHRRRHLQEK